MTKRVIICGTLSGREGIDKITKAGFTPLASCHVGPPILKECPINLECKVESTASMGTHSWVVGNVLAVYQDEDLAVGRRQLIWRSMPEYCSVSEAD
jgi:flavin reductase (DIM6/NTAB) family NADH-FMN oxidoreductase RutF